MARTDAEIHQILRTIMPGPGFQADLMDKAIKWIMTAVGTVVVIAGLGIVFALGNQGHRDGRLRRPSGPRLFSRASPR